MTCDQVRPLLEALTARDLGWGTAWRVRRHLAACPACASELAVTRRLDSRARLWQDVSAPTGLQSRIAIALPDAEPVNVSRRPLVVRRAAIGLAGVAAASAAFFWLVPGQPGHPTMAFADVEQAMQHVETLSWVTTSYDTDAHGNRLSTDAGGHKISASDAARTWVRRNPAAIATLDQRTGWLDSADKRGEIFKTAEGTYQESPKPPGGEKYLADKVEHDIRKMTQAPTDHVVSRSQGDLTMAYTGKSMHPVSSPFHMTTMPVQRQQVTLNGRAQTLFTRDQR